MTGQSTKHQETVTDGVRQRSNKDGNNATTTMIHSADSFLFCSFF